ncbi:MAG: hypothetical protein F6K16_27440 [Symploca sp. SIO2B6]|nr:hypothetical protein [Symploca sp. SIO2B6]
MEANQYAFTILKASACMERNIYKLALYPNYIEGACKLYEVPDAQVEEVKALVVQAIKQLKHL